MFFRNEMKQLLIQPTSTVAIVTPYFPPATLAGVHRARHLAKHLPMSGWIPIIVRTDEAYYTERLDPLLTRLVPQSVEQVRSSAVPAKLARCFGVGDVGLRGWFGFRAALDKLAREGRVQAVLFTGSPFYPMLHSRYVRETLNLPVVLDFQDPWFSAEGAAHSFWSKRRMAHRLAILLEPRAVRYADAITSVSLRQNDELASRYPWFDRSRMEAIPIGGDPDDFEELRLNPPKNQQIKLSDEYLNFVYVGTFLPRSGDLVRVLFDALSDLRGSKPTLAQRIRFTFVGTSNQPDGVGGRRVMPIAKSAGVSDLVVEHPQRVPYLEAISLLMHAHCHLIIGSDEHHYTASKIYPSLMSGKPFLSVFHRASSAHAILSASGGGLVYGFETEQDLADLRVTITDGLARLAENPTMFGRANPAFFNAFSARNVAAQFAEVLNLAVAHRRMGK